MPSADDGADVPSPIDFLRPADAKEWAATALLKGPWREEFFRAFAAELESLRDVAGAAVLELGSGPGFLARRILASLPHVAYTALDFSPAMHALARQHLGALAARVHFLVRDFRPPGWAADLPPCHAVVTLQAVHELRHKRHAVGFYTAARTRLFPGGVLLTCDHFRGPGGKSDLALFMTLPEHEQALRAAGFSTVREIRRQGSLVLYRAVVKGP
jgi:SAM-dependent methyltransferase